MIVELGALETVGVVEEIGAKLEEESGALLSGTELVEEEVRALLEDEEIEL